MGVTEIAWLFAGFCLSGFAALGMERRQRRDEKTQLELARQLLAKHGYTPQMYLPAMCDESDDVRAAMNRVSMDGHLIINRAGEVVGKLAPPRDAPAGEKPKLRLVVSHD